MPFWNQIQGVASLITLTAAVLVFGYQYVEWRYGVHPGLSLYLHSYIFRQLLVAVLALGALTLALGWHRPSGDSPRRRVQRIAAGLLRVTPRRLVAIVVLAAAIPILVSLSPHHVSHIRIGFLDEPQYKVDAFAYAVYELNRLQRSWHFDVDPDPFNPNTLTPDEAARCSEDPVYEASLFARGQPFIGITQRSLGRDSFWVNEGSVSVISTANEAAILDPLTPYEYLAFGVVTQSIVIHLRTQGSGLPSEAFRESRSGFGGLFQFTPRRSLMKAEILASQLTPDEERLLMNEFGFDYMKTCSSLLTLDWLYGARVRGNLEKCFNVTLAGEAR